MILKNYKYWEIERKFAWKPTKVYTFHKSELGNAKFEDGSIVGKMAWLQFIYRPLTQTVWYEKREFAEDKKI